MSCMQSFIQLNCIELMVWLSTVATGHGGHHECTSVTARPHWASQRLAACVRCQHECKQASKMQKSITICIAAYAYAEVSVAFCVCWIWMMKTLGTVVCMLFWHNAAHVLHFCRMHLYVKSPIFLCFQFLSSISEQTAALDVSNI